jgi:hypothetical protein
MDDRRPAQARHRTRPTGRLTTLYPFELRFCGPKISAVPALRNREIVSVARYQRAFREFLGDRMGDPAELAQLRAELAAAAVVAAHNHVLRRWLRGESPDPLTEFDLACAR